MAATPQARKKLREAAFFFRHLSSATERTPLVGTEEFDFYLSAFLSAARSVTFALQDEEGALYKSWYPTWNSALDDSDRALLQFMNEQRVAEVHQQGASVETRIEMLPVTEIQAGKQLSHPAYGPHSFVPPETPPPTIGVRVDYFRSQENPERAIVTCRRYLELLQKLLNDFDNSLEGRVARAAS